MTDATYAAAAKIINAMDVAFGGRSQWGPEELAVAMVGHIANQGFPRDEWYAPVEVLAHEEDDGLPVGWGVRFSGTFNAEMAKRAKRRFINAEL